MNVPLPDNQLLSLSSPAPSSPGVPRPAQSPDRTNHVHGSPSTSDQEFVPALSLPLALDPLETASNPERGGPSTDPLEADAAAVAITPAAASTSPGADQNVPEAHYALQFKPEEAAEILADFGHQLVNGQWMHCGPPVGNETLTHRPTLSGAELTLSRTGSDGMLPVDAETRPLPVASNLPFTHLVAESLNTLAQP